MEARLTALNREEALRYLGVRGAPPEDLRADLARCEARLLEAVRPRLVWRLMPLAGEGPGAVAAFRPEGQDLGNLLRDCSDAVLFAATLGAEADLLIRRAEGRSMADAVMLDALASAAVENVCDNFCLDLARELAPRALTPRFSPGYGDYPLARQAELCAALDVTRRIGVTLTPGGLMVPRKTVTAVIGVRSGAPVPGAVPGCGGCRLAERCLYRKEGSSCGK